MVSWQKQASNLPPATSRIPRRKAGFKITGEIIRLFRPLLKVSLLGYRVEIANALFPDGPPEGEVAGRHPARILFVGDIAASSYNVLNHGLGVASQTSRYVAREHNIGCSWTTISETEMTMSRAANAVHTMELKADAVIVIVGVPDVLLGTTQYEWTKSLERIVTAVRQSATPECPVIVAAIPPMHRFRAMPKFVQRILALQIQRLNRASAAVASAHPGVTYSSFPSLATAGMFIEDAFNWRAVHSHWGKQLGAATARALRTGTSAS
ncbi:GDSL-like Lipase/Acylhydrolase domain protein [marine actinobacterium PHSC20C1]|nr:GDSL-like Lipase/Acylhydrolase domain protein [marine actinobacterium PHSC20C1]